MGYFRATVRLEGDRCFVTVSNAAGDTFLAQWFSRREWEALEKAIRAHEVRYLDINE